VITYSTSSSTEHFVQMVTKDKLVGFLRLSLPTEQSFIDELKEAAIIREVHVYGPAQRIGKQEGKAQHRGVGAQLIHKATELASLAHFSQLAVISAIGTRDYYRKQGFTDGQLYQFLPLAK
jgi:elongator complex protein 3